MSRTGRWILGLAALVAALLLVGVQSVGAAGHRASSGTARLAFGGTPGKVIVNRASSARSLARLVAAGQHVPLAPFPRHPAFVSPSHHFRVRTPRAAIPYRLLARLQAHRSFVRPDQVVGGPCGSKIGTWVGLPYLNRFYDGGVANGACTYQIDQLILPNTYYHNLPSDMIIPAGTQAIMESNIYLQPSIQVNGQTYGAGVITLQPGASILSRSGSINVGGGGLSAGPGTSILFSATGNQAALNVYNGSSVSFSGTSANPVTLGSDATTPQAGDWQGIVYWPGTTGTLTNVNVVDAGADSDLGTYGCASCHRATAILTAGATLSLQGTTIDHSAGNGLEMWDNTVPAVSGSSFTNNTGFPAYFDGNPTDLSTWSNNSASGNGENGLGIGSHSDAGTGTWPNIGMPIILHDDFYGIGLGIPAGNQLTVGPGATLEFDHPDALAVDGALLMGSASGPPVTVTTTGKASDPANWAGIYVTPGATATLTDVHLANAGAPYNNLPPAALWVSSGGNAALSGSTIDKSAGSGIDYDNNFPSVNLVNDTIENNAGWAIYQSGTSGGANYVPADLTGIQNLTVSGNGHNAFGISEHWYTGAGTWPNIGIPYVLDNTSLVIQPSAYLTVAPGATIQFESGHALFVDGGLSMGDTSGPQSTLTDVPGSNPAGWIGVNVDNGGVATLDNVTINDAGHGSPGNYGENSALLVIGGTSVSLTGSTIANSAGDGIDYANGGSPVSLLGDTIENNAGWAINFVNWMPSDLTGIQGLTASGNGHNAIDMAGPDYTGNGAWPNLGLPIVLSGSDHGHALYVPRGAQLSIAAGNTLLLNNGEAVLNAGSLNLGGSGVAPVTFASSNGQVGLPGTAQPGDWGGIVFAGPDDGDNAMGEWHHVIIEDAGGNGSPAAVWLKGTSPTLDHVTVSNSVGIGFRLDNTWGSIPSPMMTYDSVISTTGWAVYYPGWVPGDLTYIHNFTASGDGHNAIGIGGRDDTYDGIWPNLNVPVVMDGNDLRVDQNVHLLLGADSTVELNAGRGVDVYGTLNAAGTNGHPATLTSANATPAPGDWAGLYFEQGSGSGGNLTYLHLSYAGAGWCCGHNFGIFINGSNPTITNSSIDHIAGDDVDVANGAAPDLEHDNFQSVPANAFGVQALNASGVDATCSFWGDVSGPTAADNAGGTGTPVSSGVTYQPFLGRPGAVGGVSVAPGVRSVTVSWNPLSDTCGDLTGYSIRYTYGSTTGTLTAGPSASSAVISGLPNGQTVSVTVAAVNTYATGAASAAQGATTFALPGKVTGVQATAGTGSATLSWLAPANGGTSITSYTATCTNTGNAADTHSATTPDGTTLSVVVSGLSGTATYSCTVAAANSAGAGPASDPVTVGFAPPVSLTPSITSASVAYGSPLSFTVTAADPDGDTLTWKPVTGLPTGLTVSTLPAAGRGPSAVTISGSGPGHAVAAVPGTYSLTFAVNDGHGPDTTFIVPVTITKQVVSLSPATRTASTNPLAPIVLSGTSSTGTILYSATIKETWLGAPGASAIDAATPFAVTLTQIAGSGTVPAATGCATTGTAAAVAGAVSTLSGHCLVSRVPVGVYDVHLAIGSGSAYFTGSEDLVLTVVDSTYKDFGNGVLSRSVGGGTVSADFGFLAKPCGAGAPAGGFVYVEHRAGGDIVVTSTGLTSCALSGTGTRTATIVGGVVRSDAPGTPINATLTAVGGIAPKLGLQLAGAGSDINFPPVATATGSRIVTG